MAETVSPLVALSNDLAATVDRAGRSIVAVHARHRLPSSGIHWRTGFVVTADHAVKREEEITVTLPDGRTEPASLAARDPATDIAVLRIDSALLSAATIGPDDALQVGHIALAVGRGESGVTASLGVVSALGGPWRTWRGGTIDRFVRLDLTLYPGSSGGALIDVQGRVLGLNTSGLTRSVDVAIPAATVTRILDELLTRGRVARGYLGVGMQPVRVGDTRGVIVLSVEPDGPAAQAGLLVGDVLLALDGSPVRDTDDVQAALRPENVGRRLAASVSRGGASVQLGIVVGERPSAGQGPGR